MDSPGYYSPVFQADWQTDTVPSASQVQRFVMINYSQIADLELRHGHAVRLHPQDSRVPFFGAFLIHELAVRAAWPFKTDRPINMPPAETSAPDNFFAPRGGDGGPNPDGNGQNDEHEEEEDSPSPKSMPGPSPQQQFPTPASNTDQVGGHGQMMMTNLFNDPVELERIRYLATQQPNWKATEIEGQTWEGTAEENLIKYQRIVPYLERDS